MKLFALVITEYTTAGLTFQDKKTLISHHVSKPMKESDAIRIIVNTGKKHNTNVDDYVNRFKGILNDLHNVGDYPMYPMQMYFSNNGTITIKSIHPIKISS